MSRLAAEFVAGNGSVLSAVANGEVDFGIIFDFMPLNAAAAGSPRTDSIDEVGQVAAFLASDAASGLTGTPAPVLAFGIWNRVILAARSSS